MQIMLISLCVGRRFNSFLYEMRGDNVCVTLMMNNDVFSVYFYGGFGSMLFLLCHHVSLRGHI